jgi:hypothetical protein
MSFILNLQGMETPALKAEEGGLSSASFWNCSNGQDRTSGLSITGCC